MPVESTSSSSASPSVSGIQAKSDGTQEIPSSVRADGSIRTPIRVRPGFVPAEDVQKYVPPRTRRVVMPTTSSSTVLRSRTEGVSSAADEPRQGVKMKSSKTNVAGSSLHSHARTRDMNQVTATGTMKRRTDAQKDNQEGLSTHSTPTSAAVDELSSLTTNLSLSAPSPVVSSTYSSAPLETRGAVREENTLTTLQIDTPASSTTSGSLHSKLSQTDSSIPHTTSPTALPPSHSPLRRPSPAASPTPSSPASPAAQRIRSAKEARAAWSTEGWATSASSSSKSKSKSKASSTCTSATPQTSIHAKPG